ncbi:MAG: glycosyltransferase family 4 protein [Candidatus Liptonbacteria bacterium]|nr:glycosyltransferase family 4 protein [Candidatus Liptonbacteria bacterium]
MKVLLVADAYPPEVSSAATLIQELSSELKKHGDEVFVLTTYPGHYLAESAKADNFGEFSDENGIKVIRVKTLPLKGINFILRGISQLLLPYILFFRAKKYLGNKLDAVIVYSPPVTLSIVGSIVKRKYGAKFLLNLQDIFPQNAIDLGVLKKKHAPAIWLFEAIEKFAYARADIITFHSPGGRRFLVEKKNVPENKIVTLANWVDIKEYEGPTRKDFRKEYGLEKKFVFLFAGIMGPAQGMEFLVEVANKVKDLKDAVFLLVGGGMEKEKVLEAIKKYGLQNVIIKKFVSKEEYPDLAKSADVGLVCLSPKNKTPFVPGKFLGYMAAGKPVLAFLNKESDGFELVRESSCGFTAVAGDLDSAEKAVRTIYGLGKAGMKDVGQNGLRYARAHFSLASAADKIRQLLGS